MIANSAGRKVVETQSTTVGEPGGRSPTETQFAPAARRFSTAIGVKP